MTELELAEELGHEVGSPELDEAIAQAEAATQTAAALGTTADETEVDVFAQESETGLWIVQLEGEPLATYDGGVRGLSATSIEATGQERLDVSSTRSQAYLAHLQDEHASALSAMTAEIGHDVEVTQTYHHVLNGMTVRASAEEAAAYAELPGVAKVFPDEIHQMETDVSNELISSPTIWQGATGTGLATQGEGVVVGMIDSGVNPHHPSFAATDGEGYTHTNPYGAGTYVGLCDPAADDHQDVCNDKLIGVYNYTNATWEDTDGHGSHVGSTMAGNTHQAQFEVGSTEWDLTVQGVAPRANVISYKICSPGCASSNAIAAVNQAIEDGVDVLNYSISGPDNPWNNAVDLAFLDAFEAGIFVSASAGNTGPMQGTVTKTAPWNATVAASNSPRLIAQALRVTGPDPVPGALEELSAVPGTGPGITGPISAELREIPDNVPGCTAFEQGAFEGVVALVERGGCEFGVKVNHAADAGAIGVVMTNQMPGPPIVMGALEETSVPAVMTSLEEGTVLREFVREHGNSAQIVLDSASTLTRTDEWSTIVADFSGRGPSRYNLLNPTFTAPGRNILAATAASGENAATYEFMQGTSMASPHGAGAGALLRGLHADWSPAMIRSALASTADPEGMLKDDGTTAADAFDVGSGLLDLGAAGRVGLVMDETTENFRAANPSQDGDPRTLNLPAIVDDACEGTCTFERELTNVADVTATYSVQTAVPESMDVTVEPATFTLEPGAIQAITVTVDASGSTPDDGWHFGEVHVTTGDTHAQGEAIADVRYPVTIQVINPVMEVTPESRSVTMGVDLESRTTVTVRNSGTGQLHWEVDGDGPGCALPEWVRAEPVSGEVAPRFSQQIEVTFDSSDLAGGTYEATLCVDGNDPMNRHAEVALTMEVVEIPAVDTDSTSIEVTQAAGTNEVSTLEISNVGYGTLDWTLADAEAGPSAERVEMLREGLLLTPASEGAKNVVALDAHDGDLVDSEFIPQMAAATPLMVLPTPDDTGVLVSDQGGLAGGPGNVISKYDLDGNYVGVFAPRHGFDPDMMQNIRGMTWSPQGTLIVAVFQGGNANSLVEFDDRGNYLGPYVAPGLDGLTGPWVPLFRDHDLLVSANGSRMVHSFSTDGTEANAPFNIETRWPVQIAATAQDTVLAAVWSTARNYLPVGIHEFDADGELLWSGEIPDATHYAGVHELGNGNILATTGEGIYELDRDGGIEQKWAGSRTRMIGEVTMPDLQVCQTPDEIPWLDVDPLTGQNARSTSSTVSITTDSTGMDLGEHTAQLCVSSNDPIQPYVPVDVSMTVTEAQAPTCDTTIDGRVNGGLTVTGSVCVEPGAVINGGVTVRASGALFMDGARVNGGLTSVGASWLEITDNRINGGATITGTTDVLVFEGNDVKGGVRIYDNPAID